MLRMVTIRLIGAGQRGDTGDLQAEHPEVDAVAGREQRAGVRRVHEPAAVGGAAEEPRGVQEDAAERGSTRSRTR